MLAKCPLLILILVLIMAGPHCLARCVLFIAVQLHMTAGNWDCFPFLSCQDFFLACPNGATVRENTIEQVKPCQGHEMEF